ncbi:hypothetical protein [Ramlibacter sp.]|uniref:hypothetical protein n=1 Tax=Ramlibacter sp. TaxID=1917967 RepID=UPI002BAAFB11|nr:hypothetical protein [Ramlibacter sp.]HWI81188.1 hypothetical protein [Ramlibacter sp.]
MERLKMLRVVWPAFLAACALELIVFALVDPSELAWSGHPLPFSRQSVYTASFFVFWLVSSVSNAITVLLCKSAAEVNVCPFQPQERPQGCPQQ